MAAMILDGRSLAKTIREELRPAFAACVVRLGRPATLAVVQVAGDAASDRYVRSIRRSCEEIGAACAERQLPAETTQHELNAALMELSNSSAVDGIILQLPLPAGLDQAAAISWVAPGKDVDGVHPENTGRLAQGLPGFVPNTPAGGMELLTRSGIAVAGKRAVVVGRSVSVGKPMALLLLNANATVTIAHSRTPDLAAVVRAAEIVVAAVGRAGLITADMVRPGAAVVDFGINVAADGAVTGDVAYAEVAAVAGAITPVPGGTGPMTNVMLLRNLLLAAGG